MPPESTELKPVDYDMSLLESLEQIDAREWDAIEPEAGWLLSHDFLSLFERSGSVGEKTGWVPRHALLRRAGQVVAACPLYLKRHSYGEFVFDWAWAEASERAGLPYFPKWLTALPFTPVPGARLLARDDAARSALAQGLVQLAKQSGLSSMHVLLGRDQDQEALEQVGFLRRRGVQFHWRNHGYQSFDDYLASLTQPKRKKVRAERRKVGEHGLHIEVCRGDALTESDWQRVYTCYAGTYAVRGQNPYLTPAFFTGLAQFHAARCVLALARRDGQIIACSLLWEDDRADGQRLYGRYWGCLEHYDMLHFELCYYAPIEWAIAHGIAVIEGGAQGEHKMARGFEPVDTCSAHWLAHPGLREAVADFLRRERAGVAHYRDELDERNPVRGS